MAAWTHASSMRGGADAHVHFVWWIGTATASELRFAQLYTVRFDISYTSISRLKYIIKERVLRVNVLSSEHVRILHLKVEPLVSTLHLTPSKELHFNHIKEKQCFLRFTM